ncbi:MAG: hypothetical protein FVQ82_12645 [Planctomycetes bacterium]|nr:hypothetical protein [Planctomycetota bacterium]
MIKIEFNKDYREYFAGLGLVSFDDFFSYSKGSFIGKNKKRDVTSFTLKSDGGSKEFFMKRFIRPHFKDMLFAGCKSGHICSQGQYEWENAKFLLDNGIMTYRPVCFGMEMRFGIESRSFFVTEKLDGQCFQEFVTENFSGMSGEEKKRVIENLGRFIRRVHDAGVNMPDLYVWHLYLESEDAATCDFALIDLHRMSTSRAVKKTDVVRNLAAFDFSMADKYFDDEMRYLLVDSYMQNSQPGQVERLYKKIKRRSKVLRARRGFRDY